MTEKVKESISALVDEEISEIELHRLLRQYSDDPSIREQFVSYQAIRAVVRGEHSFSSAQHIELHSRICAAIDQETIPEFSNSLSRSTSSGILRSNWAKPALKPALGFAVAASLVVAVFAGFNISMTDSPGNVEVANVGNNVDDNAGAVVEPSVEPSNVRNAFRQAPGINGTVSVDPASVDPASVDQRSIARSQEAVGAGRKDFTVLRELDEDKQKQLRQYLNQHDRSRMNPYERTVIFKQPAKKN